VKLLLLLALADLAAAHPGAARARVTRVDPCRRALAQAQTELIALDPRLDRLEIFQHDGEESSSIGLVDVSGKRPLVDAYRKDEDGDDTLVRRQRWIDDSSSDRFRYIRQVTHSRRLVVNVDRSLAFATVRTLRRALERCAK
jgi:hypothetical protein